jgi:rhombotarget A family protien
MCNQNKKQQAYLETLPMPISQGRLITCLILSAFSATTWADSVLVNTTADKSVDDEFCSLREAINYINLKNSKKAIIDEELAIISGGSSTLTLDNANATAALNAEKAKATPDTAEIARLEAKIKAIQDKYDASLLGLNTNLLIQQNELTLETGKIEPDAKKVQLLNDNIASLKAKLKTQQEAKATKEKELQDYRNKGVNGCKSASSDAVETVQLQNAKTPYEINNSPIIVNMSVNFALATPSTNTEVFNLEKTGADIEPRTVIKAIGNHALFIIDDGKDNTSTTATTSSSVIFANIDFQGCGSNFCEVNGGLFSNKENLIINNSIISGGNASELGGAIYNAKNAIFSGSGLLFKNNTANDGAAIYSEQTAIFISSSLFTGNTALNSIVTVANQISPVRQSDYPSIINSTFSGNTGTAISSRSSLTLKNLTVVLNSNGINFNNEPPFLYSSIVAANIQKDCLNVGAILSSAQNITYVANNVYQTGCELTSTFTDVNFYNPNHQKLASTVKIIADTDINGKKTGDKCAAPPAQGLLCPLSDNGGLTNTHKPRLLVEYKSLSDSPIVNKGFVSAIAYSKCPDLDQRARTRTSCDIGAVELQGLISSTQGQDITYGQKAIFDLFEKIGDGELLPASQCTVMFGSIADGYKDGCLRLLNFPTKGVVNFDDINHQVIYNTTLPDFHGFDKFSYLMTTTISRFSDARNDQEVKISVKVVSDPDTPISSKSLDTGTTSIFSLLMLSLLMVWRRTR